MKTAEFDYDLPQELIAQKPLEPRDSSRLLVLRRDSGSVEHATFREIGNFLAPGDLLVLNQTRVIPARIFARKLTGGHVEILLIKKIGQQKWECLVGGKGIGVGKTLVVENGPSCKVDEVLEGARRTIHFEEAIEPFLSTVGHMPLPPYIHEDLVDPDRYQTVFARIPGSAAAPTAGLHFTESLLNDLSAKGISLARITLHVGLDTFAPVNEDDPALHEIHSEWCEIPPETITEINATRSRGKKVVAVGTTTVRTLESAELKQGALQPFSGNTNIFITPGYHFKVIDAMVTNFHLPKSTLIMLVSAFAGRTTILNTYEIAKKELYRFYSFGDAMLIL